MPLTLTPLKTGQPIPDRLLTAIEASRRVFPAHSLRLSLAAAALDLKLHEARPRPAEELEQELFRQIYYPLPSGVAFTASNGHFTGYEATYWSYLWAEGVSAAALEKVLQSPKGVFNVAELQRFRRLFLNVGAAKGSSAILESLFHTKFKLCPTLLKHAGLDLP